MIAWFGEYFELIYLEEEQSREKLLKTLSASKDPAWLFGTAFHFVNILDDSNETQTTLDHVHILKLAAQKENPEK